MIVAVPSLDEKGLDAEISEHFGHAPYFIVIDIEKEKPRNGEVKKNPFTDEECKVKIVSNHEEGPHTCASPVNKLLQHNVKYLLVSGIGGGAFNMLRSQGIELYSGGLGTVREALRDFLCGMLMPLGQSSCGHSHVGGSCQH
ncbi:MAG: NifB/NifX family molybdenum-iron cluster-binding protein [Candidatus Helarchaeota archaeon]